MNYPVIPRTFFSGDCFDAYRILGAHPCTDPNGAEGWRFAVWAPGATAVEVCGGFDGWERGVPMEKADTGVWSAFIPGLAEGDLYKYRVHGADGSTVMSYDQARIDAIDGERALLLAFLIAAKYACETGHHRAFARARSTEQQHTFTWPDGEIDGTQREVLTRGVPPSPAAGLYRSRINLHQTRALLRPDSKRSRAPVTASARDKYQTTTPAITTPEMMEPTRYQVTRRPFQPGLVAQ